MKKMISIVVILAMVFALVPVGAGAAQTVASGSCGEGVSWALSAEGVLTFIGAGSMGTERPWYGYIDQITAVVIGQGITDITPYAFARMDVTTVSIPDSVTVIGAGAFFGTALGKVELSGAVAEIGYGAFAQCPGLTGIFVDGANRRYHDENGLLYDGDTLIRVPAGVTAVTFPGELPEIAVDAFRGVTAAVTSVEEPIGTFGGELTWTPLTQPQPALKPQYCSAAFEGAIWLNVYFMTENLENPIQMGLLTFDHHPKIGTAAEAMEIVTDWTFDGSRYMVHTGGIPAKNLGDTLYLRLFAQLSDGSYLYSDIKSYSVQTYAEGLLKNTNPAVSGLAREILDYGAAAQTYFGYKTDTLMNACLDTAHVYADSWIGERPATLTMVGSEYRTCIRCGGGRQSRTTQQLTVRSLAVTEAPEQTVYRSGEAFNPKGMVLTATLSDGTTAAVEDYTYHMEGSTVTLSYGGASTQLSVTLTGPELLSVEQVFDRENGTAVYVEGLYVGVAEEGASSDKELLLKDLNSDAIIAVRNVPYGIFPEYGYEYGDQLRILAHIHSDGTANTPNKRYLEFSPENGRIQSTLVSVGNAVSYALDSAVKVSSWEQMQALFTVGAIAEYTFVEFTGELLVNRYDGSDGIGVSRMHLNGDATGISGIRTDGKRTVSLRDNVMERNLGRDWERLMFSQMPDTGSYPGCALSGRLVALYTGANGYYYQLTVLDPGWIDLQDYDNYDVVTEVAYAFHRQGNQIQYDQTQSRRNLNPSPEDATAANTLYMDCSSYVNGVYYEAFGENVLPYDLQTMRPSTAAFTDYARENPGAVDVIGYWENGDYTTATAINDVLEEVRSQLRVGDLLVYRHGQTEGSSGHVYIYVGEDTFLHCTGSSFVYGDTPSESCDKATADEKTIGAVQTISAQAIFVDTSDKRYLFKVTDSDSVYNFSLLRPLARGLLPTEESKKRMSIRGVDLEKQFSKSAVCLGDTLTCTLTLTNYSDIRQTVLLEETLSQNVSYAGGMPICVGDRLRWRGGIPAGGSVVVSYTLTVEGGGLVESRTSLNGVTASGPAATVSGYSEERLQTVAAQAQRCVGRTFADPMDLAAELYPETDFGGTTAMAVLSAVIDKKNDTCLDHPLLVPNLYGGLDIKNGFVYDNQRTRLVRQENLAVGDVIVAEYDGICDVFLYCGDGLLVQASSTAPCTQVTSSGNIYAADDILVTLTAYDRFAVLRPSRI